MRKTAFRSTQSGWFANDDGDPGHVVSDLIGARKIVEVIAPGRRSHSGCGLSRYITTPCFTDQPSLERFDGLDPPSEQIHAPATALAEAPPFSHQRRITEQSRFDREDIEPRHIAGRIAPLEHEVWHREFGHAQESQLSELTSN